MSYIAFFFFFKCEVHIMFMCTKTKSNNSSINFSLFQYLNKIIIQFAIIKYKKICKYIKITQLLKSLLSNLKVQKETSK